MNPDRARLAVSLIDLTDLPDDLADGRVEVLCERARTAGTAAVCVWPEAVASAAHYLSSDPIAVATVVNFPTGDERPFAIRVLTERVLSDGADEIDLVLPYRAFSRGDHHHVTTVLDTVRSATDGRALMKVILETGELAHLDLVADAARCAIDHGADFVKTSTGKTPISATPEVVRVLLGVIGASRSTVGIKPSGGIRTAEDADLYLRLAEASLGSSFLTPDTFRIGASGLLDALIAVIGGRVVEPPSPRGY